MKPSQTLRTGWKAVDDDCAVIGLRLTALHAAENSVLYQGTTLVGPLIENTPGFRACAGTAFPNSVPQGRLNLAQDASPGLDLKRRLVPQGRLEIGRDAILDNLQPSRRD